MFFLPFLSFFLRRQRADAAAAREVDREGGARGARRGRGDTATPGEEPIARRHVGRSDTLTIEEDVDERRGRRHVISGSGGRTAGLDDGGDGGGARGADVELRRSHVQRGPGDGSAADAGADRGDDVGVK